MEPGTKRKAGMTVKQTDGVKIVTIGGGSSYTPELMEGLINRYDQVPVREIWLVDIEEGKEKLEIVGEMARRMWNASGHDVQVHLTLDRREALKDADLSPRSSGWDCLRPGSRTSGSPFPMAWPVRRPIEPAGSSRHCARFR